MYLHIRQTHEGCDSDYTDHLNQGQREEKMSKRRTVVTAPHYFTQLKVTKMRRIANPKKEKTL